MTIADGGDAVVNEQARQWINGSTATGQLRRNTSRREPAIVMCQHTFRSEGKRVKAFEGIAHKLGMRLDQLEAATSLQDLDLPGNRLEALKGDRKGQYSIRLKDQWRICFEWPKGVCWPLCAWRPRSVARVPPRGHFRTWPAALSPPARRACPVSLVAQTPPVSTAVPPAHCAWRDSAPSCAGC